MNKRKAKSIAYNYFASLVDEMVNNCDREHVFFERVGEVCDNSEEDS